jgi:hypothetical protein
MAVMDYLMDHLDELQAGVSRARTIWQVAAERRIATETPEVVAKAVRLGSLLKPLSPVDRLRKLREEIAGRIVFTTSFGLEDQVILQMLLENDIDVDLVTLDTGRLFPQTYDLWAETEQRFGRRISAIYPSIRVEQDEYDQNLFFSSNPRRSGGRIACGQHGCSSCDAVSLARVFSCQSRLRDRQCHHAAPCRPNQTSSDVGMIGMITASARHRWTRAPNGTKR